MKIYISTLAMCFVTIVAAAQDFHINLFAGTSNYQGDLQSKRFTFSQSHVAAGVGLSYDLSDKFSVRSGIILGRVSGDDKLGTRNQFRNLNFTSNLTEVNVGLQYYITPLADHAFTPYVFAGIAVYHFNPYTFDTSGQKFYLRPLSTEGEGFIDGVKNYSLTQFAIPFGGGIKLSLTDNFNIGIEFGLRKLFTDHLDDLSGPYVDQNLLLLNRGAKAVELAYRGNELKNGAPYPAANTIRGGPKNKDWYYFTGLTASFTLGNGDIGNSGGHHSKYGCPANVN